LEPLVTDRNDGIITPYGTTLPTTGGAMSGPIAMGANQITGLAAGVLPTDAVQLQQAYQSQLEYYLNGAPAFMRTNLFRSQAGGNLAALTTQVMTSVAVLLFAGEIVTNLTFMSGATAAGSPTNWWFALHDTAATPALIAQSADQTTTAWAADTAKTLALSAPYTVPTTGIYYADVMVKATTVPTLIGATVQADASGAVVAGMKVLARTSGSSLTATAPSTIATPTTVGTVPYVVIT
jgi:hypothetical protein